MEEDKPLPLARMVTINKPSFIIFLTACFALYICEWQYNHAQVVSHLVTNNQIIILAVVFIGLLLNIIAVSIKNQIAERRVITGTYLFEVFSIIAIVFLIFLPR